MKHPPSRALVGTLATFFCALALAQTHVDLHGHRGARGLLPENTLAAFEAAIKLGVSALELDVVVTKDDVLVVSHERALNPDLTRSADGRFIASSGPNIIDLTLEQVQAYDVGKMNPESNYARQFREQKPADGQKIPRLRDVLDLVKTSGNTKMKLEIEIKSTPLRPEQTPPPERFVDMPPPGDRRKRAGGSCADPVFRLAHPAAGAAPEPWHADGLSHGAAS